MVKVAVAGGTGGLGRTIVDELEANPHYDYIILSRGVSSDLISIFSFFSAIFAGCWTIPITDTSMC